MDLIKKSQNTEEDRIQEETESFFMHSQIDTSTIFLIYAYSLSVYSDLSRINSGGFE